MDLHYYKNAATHGLPVLLDLMEKFCGFGLPRVGVVAEIIYISRFEAWKKGVSQEVDSPVLAPISQLYWEHWDMGK